MSGQKLNEILRDVLKVLNKDLRAELDYEQTELTITPSTIVKAVTKQLLFTYAPDEKGNARKKFPIIYELYGEDEKILKTRIYNIIKRKIPGVIKELHKNYLNLINKDTGRAFRGVSIKVTPIRNNRFTVITTTTAKTKAGKINKLGLDIIYRGRKVRAGSFAVLKEGYRDIMRELWKYLGDVISQRAKKRGKTLNDEEKKAFNSGAIDLEHKKGESVAERRRQAAAAKLLEDLEKDAEGGGDLKAKIAEVLNLQVWLDYKSNDISNIVAVYLGSKSLNRSRGATEEARIIKVARKSLKAAIKKNKNKIKGNPAAWGGSDSRIDIITKQVVSSFVKNLNKKIKSKTIDTKLKLSRRKTQKEEISGKRTKLNKAELQNDFKTESKTLPVSTQTSEPVLNLNALKAEINARLSMTVIKNMGTPALENRTGRFARSVEVTDVIPTPKGFPSIGYTYQKGPYQTFEPGFAQGSTQRDPRILINRSIREIAKELIVGRFYTRRT
jgi:hypothetical protein